MHQVCQGLGPLSTGQSVHETVLQYPEAGSKRRVQRRTEITEQCTHYPYEKYKFAKNPVTYPQHLLIILRAKNPFAELVFETLLKDKNNHLALGKS